MTSTININELSPEQRSELVKQALEIDKAEKEKKEQDRKTFKDLGEEYIHRNIDRLINLRSTEEDAINHLFNDFEPIRELKEAVYGTKINEQDSHTTTLKDGSASITIGYNVSIGFDGTENAGVEKIRNFIKSLSDESDKVKKLTKMVNTFLKPNAKTGMLNPVKIIELSKLQEEFNNEEFNDGLKIIFDAQIRRQNSRYVSGWKFIKVDGQPKKLEFRFTVQ